jgi:hypothetical protein
MLITRRKLHVRVQPAESLSHEVVGHRTVIPRELGKERLAVGGLRLSEGASRKLAAQPEVASSSAACAD